MDRMLKFKAVAAVALVLIFAAGTLHAEPAAAPGDIDKALLKVFETYKGLS